MAPFPWHHHHSETPAAPPTQPPPGAQSPDEPAAGWDAITAVFAAAYPGQEPTHYGTVVPRRLGGPDPLDGISIYRASDPAPHWHYVTYGYSNLYGEADRPSARPGESGFGMEMTLRLYDRRALDLSVTPPVWVVNLLQNLARHVFTSGTPIRARHHLDAGGPIALDEATQLTALAFTDDAISPAIPTPNGTVAFVQAVGITGPELADILAWNTDGVLSVIGQRWPFGLTVLDRAGLDEFPELRAQVLAGVAQAAPFVPRLAVESLKVSGTDEALTIAISGAALGDVLAAAEPALRAGRTLLLCGSDCALELAPQGPDQVMTRRAPTADRPGRLSLTPDGLRVLAQLRKQPPGDYRHHTIPDIVWHMTSTVAA
ncbi:MAG: suppressor of fused domain protein [Propionibacteriaceae bacterium]|nr:suppressor of fused domain protein [Propionibacteriaceae bacterium]